MGGLRAAGKEIWEGQLGNDVAIWRGDPDDNHMPDRAPAPASRRLCLNSPPGHQERCESREFPGKFACKMPFPT